MKWMLSCKEITEICCDDDRKLNLKEKMMYWMHLGMCKACHAYKKQIEFMSGTMRKIMLDRSQVDEKKVMQFEKEIIDKISKDA